MKRRGSQPRPLRQALSDLVALSTTPAAWIVCNPSRLVESVVDLLTSALRVEVAGVRLQVGDDSETYFEAWRGHLPSGFPELLRSVKDFQEKQKHLGKTLRMRTCPAADTGLRLSITPLGVQGDYGRIVAGCSRNNFPNTLDNLLLSAAANQAVTSFQLLWARANSPIHYDADSSHG